MKHKLVIISIILAGGLVALLHAPLVRALDCAVLPQEICNSADVSGDVSNSGIFKLLIEALKILSALVGVVAVGMFIWAGILYSSGDANSQRVSQAKTVMINTTIGIVAYALMYLALNWLIPGGVFN